MVVFIPIRHEGGEVEMFTAFPAHNFGSVMSANVCGYCKLIFNHEEVAIFSPLLSLFILGATDHPKPRKIHLKQGQNRVMGGVV